jgi:hypothetical protein
MKNMIQHLIWTAVASAVALPALMAADGRSEQAEAGESAASTGQGPFAQIGFLRPRDGNTVDFEAGYTRHLEWHRQVKDPFVWYGWTIAAGERQRYLLYASFGHSASAFDNRVSPADDERDNVANIMPHAEFAGGGFYEFLPPLSRGTALGVPEATPLAELATVDLVPGSEEAFEKALRAGQTSAPDGTLWYRMIAGGAAPRYLRLRPRPSTSSILEGANERLLPDAVRPLIAGMTLEILSLRPTMSYGLPQR